MSPDLPPPPPGAPLAARGGARPAGGPGDRPAGLPRPDQLDPSAGRRPASPRGGARHRGGRRRARPRVTSSLAGAARSFVSGARPWRTPPATAPTWRASSRRPSGNGVGGAGVAAARILPVTIAGADGRATTSALVRGVRYATARGARVINISFGGQGFSRLEQEAIDAAVRAGALVVVPRRQLGRPRGRSRLSGRLPARPHRRRPRQGWPGALALGPRAPGGAGRSGREDGLDGPGTGRRGRHDRARRAHRHLDGGGGRLGGGGPDHGAPAAAVRPAGAGDAGGDRARRAARRGATARRGAGASTSAAALAAPAPPAEDPEPNDDPRQASRSRALLGGAAASGTVRGRTGSYDDPRDGFRVVLHAGEAVTCGWRRRGPPGDLDLALWRPGTPAGRAGPRVRPHLARLRVARPGRGGVDRRDRARGGRLHPRGAGPARRDRATALSVSRIRNRDRHGASRGRAAGSRMAER